MMSGIGSGGKTLWASGTRSKLIAPWAAFFFFDIFGDACDVTRAVSHVTVTTPSGTGDAVIFSRKKKFVSTELDQACAQRRSAALFLRRDSCTNRYHSAFCFQPNLSTTWITSSTPDCTYPVRKKARVDLS